jgi:hypothetical protein
MFQGGDSITLIIPTILKFPSAIFHLPCAITTPLEI